MQCRLWIKLVFSKKILHSRLVITATSSPDGFSRPADTGHALALLPACSCGAAVALPWHRLIRSCTNIPGSQNRLQKGEQSASRNSWHSTALTL